MSFRFPKLVGFAYLTPEYAAAKIVDAIEKNQVILAMPRGAYFAVALQQYVPHLFILFLVDLIPLSSSYLHFHVRKKSHCLADLKYFHDHRRALYVRT